MNKKIMASLLLSSVMVIYNANIAKANKSEENNFSAKDNYVRANNLVQESKKFKF
ncbi:MAG: hypothetical protein Q4B52_05330 [Tissierellia bacterium]|nr:hypothetical protein [Tissierellia bacterium]